MANDSTQTNARPVLFGGAHFKKAVSDDMFYKRLPQFLPIKAKMATMHTSLNQKKGCSTCNQRRVQVNLERDFAAIASSLDKTSGKLFKDYFGVKRMVMHAVNPTTHAAYLKEI